MVLLIPRRIEQLKDLGRREGQKEGQKEGRKEGRRSAGKLKDLGRRKRAGERSAGNGWLGTNGVCPLRRRGASLTNRHPAT